MEKILFTLFEEKEVLPIEKISIDTFNFTELEKAVIGEDISVEQDEADIYQDMADLNEFWNNEFRPITNNVDLKLKLIPESASRSTTDSMIITFDFMSQCECVDPIELDYAKSKLILACTLLEHKLSEFISKWVMEESIITKFKSFSYSNCYSGAWKNNQLKLIDGWIMEGKSTACGMINASHYNKKLECDDIYRAKYKNTKCALTYNKIMHMLTFFLSTAQSKFDNNLPFCLERWPACIGIFNDCVFNDVKNFFLFYENFSDNEILNGKIHLFYNLYVPWPLGDHRKHEQEYLYSRRIFIQTMFKYYYKYCLLLDLMIANYSRNTHLHITDWIEQSTDKIDVRHLSVFNTIWPILNLYTKDYIQSNFKNITSSPLQNDIYKVIAHNHKTSEFFINKQECLDTYDDLFGFHEEVKDLMNKFFS